ncbi:MAG: hypothetical protein LBS36_06210, partial [Oscillospiraceae bacterium]|nr:hypothetical protein [Oscillospiraceae bacterium]
MKRSVPIFFLLVLFLLFASCGKPAEPEATTAVENTEDAMHLIKMPVGFVRNKQEIAEPEYSHSMLNRFEAEAALPEGRKTVNKKTEDVTPLSVYNRSLAQLFIYGSGATDASLNADFLFFVRGGALSSVFGPEELGAAPERFVIHALYAADFNKD